MQPTEISEKRRHVRLIAKLTATFILSSAGCDIETFSTRPGKHVIYHWEPNERMLCGGTAAYADRLAETMTSHYGMSLDRDAGPTVEYFWSVADVGSLACPGGFACTRVTPTARSRWLSAIYSELPIHGHELAHAFVGSQDGGLPGFMDEGLAVRWQSSVLGEDFTGTTPLKLNEAQLRAKIDQLGVLSDHGDHEAAFVWLAVLEVTFGPEKMGGFLRSLKASSSSNEVDKALQRTMGISLAVSVDLAAGYLPFIFDDPVCEMEGVPTFRWDGRPIVIDRRDARCEDEDVVNLDPRVQSIVILEFPDDLHAVNVTVSGASNLLYFALQHCFGDVYWNGRQPYINGAQSDGRTWEMDLRGRWVGSLIGDIDDDGDVLLPLVEIAPVHNDKSNF